jgi:hypothetical protein
MSDQIWFDASSIYRAVLNRRSRPAIFNGQLNAAISMCEAIKEFSKIPTRDNIKRFSDRENIWLSIVGGNNKSYATELTKILQMGQRISVSSKTINSPHNKNYDPSYGFIYGMTSIQFPNLVKLGATSGKRHPQERREELIKKYGLNDLQIVFFCEVAFPARAEREWTSRFSLRRAKLPNKQSREWFNFNVFEASFEVKKIIDDLGIKEYSKWYLCREIRMKLPAGMVPVGRNSRMGTLNNLG